MQDRKDIKMPYSFLEESLFKIYQTIPVGYITVWE